MVVKAAVCIQPYNPKLNENQLQLWGVYQYVQRGYFLVASSTLHKTFAVNSPLNDVTHNDNNPRHFTLLH